MPRILILLLLLSNTVLAQVNMTLGLRAYYPFTGNANDQSGNNNNPAFNNATPAADRFGVGTSAYAFNGNSSYMRIPVSSTLNMGNQISICAWVKPTGFYQGNCHGNAILTKGDADYLAGNYMLRFDDHGYTNNQNCSNSIVDPAHQNFYGVNQNFAPTGYTPFIQTGQWYSVVFTYDGTTAKIYVNCEFKASTVVNLTFTNTHDLYLGKMNNPSFPYWLNGVLDEVRIYNRVINIDEIKFYGDCVVAPPPVNPIGGIINTYTPVLAFNRCENKITVEDASTFNIGDTVVMIQMKGATIDTSALAQSAPIIDYSFAGNYEFNYVKSKSGNIIEFKYLVTRPYSVPGGKVQLIRVPYYQSATIISPLTCPPWDGSKGGVLVLNVRDTVQLNANIDVSGMGFRGGVGFNPQNNTLTCFQGGFREPITNNAIAGQKGETIAEIPLSMICGRGSAGGGGGGGVGHNSGGGGGTNIKSIGGMGGYQLDACGNAPYDNRGIGATFVGPSLDLIASNKVFMGSGGGAGHADNAGNLPTGGGNGGGIIIIKSNFIRSNNFKIISNGANGVPCTMPASLNCHDGMGGGGAGGAVMLYVNQFLDNTFVENKGGKGADMIGSVPLGGRIGAGGGGGGGLLYVKGSTLPSGLTNTNTGGANGVLTTDNNNAWGATSGISGVGMPNLVLAIDSGIVKPNIDSVIIQAIPKSCNSYDFNGLAYINSFPVMNWQWWFGDGGTANTQNTNHAYPIAGPYTVKLVVTDINGCKDSITKDVSASFLTMDAGPGDLICSNNSIILQASATGAQQYLWAPAQYLNNPTILNPVANPPVTTLFFLSATNAQGCQLRDSVLITVRSVNSFVINPPDSICLNGSIQLQASGGDLYAWVPGNYTVSNPVVSPQITTTYTVQIIDTLCNNTGSRSTVITVLPLPDIRASKVNDIDCSNDQSQLIGTGGIQYSWSPAATLSNPGISNPMAHPLTNTQYIVQGTDQFGCSNTDSVTVNITTNGKSGYFMANAFTPNNDGRNDCYGIKYWGVIQKLEFSIYNRWGQRLFYTKTPGDCWDGTYKNEKQNPAVYIYMINATTSCGTAFRKGTFVLIR